MRSMSKPIYICKIFHGIDGPKVNARESINFKALVIPFFINV